MKLYNLTNAKYLYYSHLSVHNQTKHSRSPNNTIWHRVTTQQQTQFETNLLTTKAKRF